MRKSVVSGVVAGAIASGVIGGVAAPAHAQDAVQWRVEDGGNGHWYALVIPTGDSLSWETARISAEATGGHLATLTSSAENDFAFSVANSPTGWVVLNTIPPYCFGPWLGGYQPRNAIEPAGGWQWVTDEVWDWTNWWTPSNEPNDGCGGGEDYLHWLGQSVTTPQSSWNDTGFPDPCSSASPISYVIEWSADCNADGLVDFGQIRVGELDDANANNIPDCCEQGVACLCPSDIDGNGTVDAIDLAIVIGYWGTNGGKEYPQADIDRSGDIDAADLAALLGAWGPCE
jgi:hypothetical protein